MAASIQKQPSKSAISLLFLPSYSTGNDPRKGWRIPLNEIKYNEQRDEETGIGYCDTYQPHAPRRIKDTENQRLYDLQWDRAGNLYAISGVENSTEIPNHGRVIWLKSGNWGVCPTQISATVTTSELSKDFLETVNNATCVVSYPVNTTVIYKETILRPKCN